MTNSQIHSGFNVWDDDVGDTRRRLAASNQTALPTSQKQPKTQPSAQKLTGDSGYPVDYSLTGRLPKSIFVRAVVLTVE